MTISIDKITEKRQILARASKNLKKHFIGIDNIIDAVISNIEVWYIMPELLTRPVVINLWGMTGVGKTDLIRRLIRELKFENSYVEIQLEAGKSTGWERASIKHHIKSGGLTPDEQGIVFLDEIQRFRSIDEHGDVIDTDKYQDIWMLLSDGQFSDYGNQKRELEMLLLEQLYDDEQKEEDEEPVRPKSKSKTKKQKFQTSLWSAQRFKDELEIDMSIEKIMKMNGQDKMELVQTKINSITLNNKVRRYSKLLIFISGNLDEAYKMSHDVSEVNIDADILHDFSMKINILNIKDALLKKFKPEQIARFGNIHIIYPSLSKSSFKKLIDRYLSEISVRILEAYNISISFDESVHRTIYRNGVYPTQGTRPLFSTLASIIESPIPTFLFEALLKKQNNIYFSIDETAEILNAKIGNEVFTKKIKLQIDAIARNTSSDKLAVVAAHESGHAVIYALILQLAPSQIVSDSNDNKSSGFIIPHTLYGSKDLFLKKIQILLAGGIAEQIVFGEQNKTNGLYTDLKIATNEAAALVRTYNMDEPLGSIISSGLETSHSFITNLENTNDNIEKILKEQRTKVIDLLQHNIEFFKKVYAAVLEKRRMLPEEFYVIAKEFIPDIKIESGNFVKSHNYADNAKSFLNSKPKIKPIKEIII